MNIEILKQRNLQYGYALMMVMILGGVSLLILASAMTWTSTNSALIDRNNQYFTSVAAAEAATEMVISELAADFQNRGPAAIGPKISTYRSRLPGAAQDGYWANFQFSDANGNQDANSVLMVSPWQTSPLVSQYRGLSGFAATYRVTSNAKELNSRNDLVGAVQQDVQLATVPIFQFAIFYNMDLEINPGPDMIVTGRVHSNGKIYTQPQSQLTFLGDVTSAQDIIADKMPGDPLVRSGGTVTYKQAHDSGVSSLNLPIGTDNSSDTVRALIEIPPDSEAADSQTGQQRYYNNSDLLILVKDTGVEVDCASAKGKFPNLLWGGANGVSNFVNINASFYNGREGKHVKATDIDVEKLIAWNADPQNPLRTGLGRDVDSIYVADLRSQSSGTEPGVRLIKGQKLPPLGLTVATPDPLYVLGNYNVLPSALGTSDTSQTKPASLIADSINILSVKWEDNNSALTLNNRLAGDTTVNAAFLAGIVPTTDGSYSGGVENFPRFLEDWGGITFTFNGSMVVMYTSKTATAIWKGTGVYYNPPTRHWNFDNNFLDPEKQPPLTPAFRTMIRRQWTTVAPGT